MKHRTLEQKYEICLTKNFLYKLNSAYKLISLWATYFYSLFCMIKKLQIRGMIQIRLAFLYSTNAFYLFFGQKYNKINFCFRRLKKY